MKPRSQQYAKEHLRHVAYHGRQAADHEAHREPEAAARHRTAAEAHEVAAATPLDASLPGMAMRGSAIADEVSQRVRKLHRYRLAATPAPELLLSREALLPRPARHDRHGQASRVAAMKQSFSCGSHTLSVRKCRRQQNVRRECSPKRGAGRVWAL